MKIKELLTDESKWTKLADARKVDREATFAESPSAVCWCIRGAVWKCYGAEEGFKILQKMNNELDCPVIEWNDTNERTFEEVRKLIEDLDI